MGLGPMPISNHSMESFEANIINNFFEKLLIFVFPDKLDMQMQLSFAVHEEQQKMDYWRETHGSPNYLPSRGNLASTPPMPLPFIDHHIPIIDNNLATSFGEGEANFSGLPSWTSGSSSSSPFRQSFSHGMAGGTISPHELVSHDTQPLAHPASYNEDMSIFTFSDSDNSLPSLPQPPLPSTHRRRREQRSGPSKRSSQTQTHQQSRRPLPAGSSQAVPSSHVGGAGAYAFTLAGGFEQQSNSSGGQEGHSHQDYTLKSNTAPTSTHTPQTSRSSRRQTNANIKPNPFVGVLPVAPSPISAFPPGQDQPGFVPIGRVGIANAAQGNTWPIERALFEQLVGAERGHGEQRPQTKLTYKEILAKYSRWDIKESTLRGIKRKITLPKEHRERKPRWDAEHVKSLCLHVPTYTDKKGKTSWTKVVDAIKRDTGRPFGAGTTSKKWHDLNKSKTKRGAAVDQQSQSGGEEGDIEENGSSSSVFEVVDVSEEDLLSHKFSFQKDDEDDDELGGVGRFVSINSPVERLQGTRLWQ